jgi:hypothetical protein
MSSSLLQSAGFFASSYFWSWIACFSSSVSSFSSSLGAVSDDDDGLASCAGLFFLTYFDPFSAGFVVVSLFFSCTSTFF